MRITLQQSCLAGDGLGGYQIHEADVRPWGVRGRWKGVRGDPVAAFARDLRTHGDGLSEGVTLRLLEQEQRMSTVADWGG